MYPIPLQTSRFSAFSHYMKIYFFFLINHNIHIPLHIHYLHMKLSEQFYQLVSWSLGPAIGETRQCMCFYV